MSAELVAAIASVIGVLVTIVGVAFISGKLTQKIEDNSRVIADHGDRLDKHAIILNTHEVEIAKLNEWRNGYNAGVASRNADAGA